MVELSWLLKEIEELDKHATSYEEKALYVGLINLFKEQTHRIETLEGELEGTLWSPQKWQGIET